jgi:hypothetical protein
MQLASLALVLTSGSLLAACGSGSSQPTAKSLVSEALTNGAAATWVHEVTHASEPGHLFYSHNDIGATSGRQNIVADGSIASVIVLPGIAYIRGNEKAVVHFFGIPTSHPKAIAGKWVSISSSTTGFATVTSAVTLASDFHEYKILGPLTEGSDVTLLGQKVLPISGFVAGPSNKSIPATLYVTTTGTVLPVELSLSGGNLKSTTVWTAWGHTVEIVAPKPSIPISKIPK